MIEAALIVCEGPEALPAHLPASLRVSPAGAPATLEEMERAHIELALRTTGGHRGHAARLPGIS